MLTVPCPAQDAIVCCAVAHDALLPFCSCIADNVNMFKTPSAIPGLAVPAAGYFKNRFGAVYPCHAGTFKSTKGNASCSRCKGRTYASRAGQKTCSQVCPRGCRVSASHTACITYPPGSQPGPGNARRPCPAGELLLHTDHSEVARPIPCCGGWADQPVMRVCWKERRGN